MSCKSICAQHVFEQNLCVKASVYVKACVWGKKVSASERLCKKKPSVCKSASVTSSPLTICPIFLYFPRSFPTSLCPAYSLPLQLLSSCCRSVSVQLFQRISSVFILTFWYFASFIFLIISCYISHGAIPLLLAPHTSTYLLHCVFTERLIHCSSTLSSHPLSSSNRFESVSKFGLAGQGHPQLLYASLSWASVKRDLGNYFMPMSGARAYLSIPKTDSETQRKGQFLVRGFIHELGLACVFICTMGSDPKRYIPL